MADAMATFLLKVVDEASSELELVNKNLEEMSKNAKALEQMRQGALVMGAAMAAGLGLAVHSAIKFESQIAPIKTLLSGTASEIEATAEEVKKSALAWGANHVNSVDDYTKSMYNALSAGLEVKASIAATQQAGLLATATNGDMAQATELLTGIYNNLGNKTADVNQEMMRLNDILGKTQQKFAIRDLNQLASGLGSAAAGANTYGVSIEQTATIIGQLNTGLVKGPEAGTAFNAMLAKMSSASKELGFNIAYLDDGTMDLVKTIGNIKATGAQGDILQQSFGEGGIKAVSALIKSYDLLPTALVEVTNSFGTVAAAAKTVESTPAAQMTIALGKLAAAGVKIGEVFLPPLALLLSGLGGILDGFNWLLDVFPPLRIAIGALIAVLAAALTIFGSWVFWTKAVVMWQGIFNLTTLKAVGSQIVLGATSIAAAIGATGAWLIANAAMVAATLGISAAVAGFIWLVQNIDNVRAGWDNLKNNLGILQFIFAPVIFTIDAILWGIKKISEGIKWLSSLGGNKLPESPAQDMAKSQQSIMDTLPAQKAMPATKTKASTPIGSNETDWGMNDEFLAANGLGGVPIRASAGTVKAVREGIQGSTQKGGAVDNSRTIHIANITVDGSNIHDWDSFKLELSAAVGGMA